MEPAATSIASVPLASFSNTRSKPLICSTAVLPVGLGGAGIRCGSVYGESDPHAAFPMSGAVSPADVTATIFHCLGYSPETLLHDQSGRPFPITRGEVIREALA